MPNYLYFEHKEKQLNKRFDITLFSGEEDTIYGIEEWRGLITILLNFLDKESNPDLNREKLRINIWKELVEISVYRNFNIENRYLSEEGRPTDILIVTLLLVKLKELNKFLPKKRCPCLFISHRKTDSMEALRIAELAEQNGFAYWVDVCDPGLKRLANIKISKRLRALLTASIIEMAILNCTHVIACMTPRSKGTMWIPYEYGRLRDLPAANINTNAWVHPDFKLSKLPEYMLLGEIALLEIEIENWLKKELPASRKSGCNPAKNGLSAFAIEKLPEKTKVELESEKKKRDFLNDANNPRVVEPLKVIKFKTP